jgi:hypothetical protein
MFKIDFSFFICYYLISQIFLFLLVWLLVRKPVIKKDLMEKGKIWQCAICTYVYFESKFSKISTCPLCGSLNQGALKEF